MPELPEVEALVRTLNARTLGKCIDTVELHSFAALKTHDPAAGQLSGLTVSGWTRLGKFLDMEAGALHLTIHLARAGWIRWSDALPPRPPSLRGPLALRVRFAGGSGFDVTERGTEKRLALYVTRSPGEVAGVRRLGIDVMDGALDAKRLRSILLSAHGQLKGVLSDQSLIAGIGNAYSDEILHAARLSPFRQASGLSDDEVNHLHEAAIGVLRGAIDRACEIDPTQLKGDKRAHMNVHGKTGESCPACGDTVRQVSFATRSLQYCPTCQTRGQILADRRLSRLLR